VSLPSAVRLPFRFDAAALAADALALDESVWQPHFNTGVYEGDWSGVALRSSGGLVALYPDPTRTDAFADTEHLATCPAVRAVLIAFSCPLTSARFLRLAPGARIKEHRDYNLGFDDGEVRLHIPVTTGPQIEFVLDGQTLAMEPGECWYTDVSRMHRVENRSPAARIHLVIDCVVDAWLEGILTEAAGASTLSSA
jgi:hypothetical protein